LFSTLTWSNFIRRYIVPLDEVIKEGMVGSELWNSVVFIFVDISVRIHSHVERHQKAKWIVWKTTNPFFVVSMGSG
jgi:hypothetical protein